MTFCDMLAHVSMRCCFKSLVKAAGVADRRLYTVHTFLHQSTHSVVNRTVWHAYHFKKCADGVYQRSSELVHRCRNYSWSKSARFLDSVLG